MTMSRGGRGGGGVFELTPGSDGTFTGHELYSFVGSQVLQPYEGLVFDSAGNLYSAADLGGDCDGSFCGFVYKLSQQAQLASSAGRPGEEEAWFLSMQADTESFGGRLGKARDYVRRAVDSELRADSKEGASAHQAYAALWQAEFGNLVQARKDVASALALSPGRDGKIVIAMALARIGDLTRANALADELQQTHPQDTLVQFYSLPSIRAAVELSRGNAAKAEEFTERARQYELAAPRTERQLSPRRFSAPANRPSLRIVRRPGQGPRCLPGFLRTMERRRSGHSYSEASQS